MKKAPDIGDFTELYVSVDIEADGQCPGLNSMISLGAAVYDVHKNLIDTFSANLLPLPEAKQDSETMEFWASEPAAWKATQTNQESPADATWRFDAWLKRMEGFGKKIVLVGAPAVYDGMWVLYYTHRFVGKSRLSWSGLDIRSYVSGYRKVPYSKSGKKFMPARWFDKDKPHTHVAVDDAIEQGAMFINILRESLGLKPVR